MQTTRFVRSWKNDLIPTCIWRALENNFFTDSEWFSTLKSERRREKISRQLRFPLLGDLPLQLGAQRIDRRETIAPGVRPASVENRPAGNESSGVALVGVHRRIKGCAPAAVDDADRGLGIAARRHRPDHIFHI